MTTESFDSRIESVRDRHRRNPEPNAKPVDPYDLREYTRDVLQGAAEKRPEIWRQVMERHGFRWFEPRELTRRVGPMTSIPSQQLAFVDPLARAQYVTPHKVGQWRNDLHQSVPEALKTAFTVEDLFGLFSTPEAFDSWFVERVARHRAARSGVALSKPRSVVVPKSAARVPGSRVILARR